MAIADFHHSTVNCAVKPVYEHLLLFHAAVSLADALADGVVLAQSEVTLHAVLFQLLLLSGLICSVSHSLQSKLLVLSPLPIEHLLNQRLDVFGLHVALDLGPDLHDGVLDLDLELILVQVDPVLVHRLSMVVEDVVQRHLVVRCEELFLDITSSLLQVSSLRHNSLQALIGQLEATDGSPADVVSVCDVLDNECTVI